MLSGSNYRPDRLRFETLVDQGHGEVPVSDVSGRLMGKRVTVNQSQLDRSERGADS
jgi:hypothetical protein